MRNCHFPKNMIEFFKDRKKRIWIVIIIPLVIIVTTIYIIFSHTQPHLALHIVNVKNGDKVLFLWPSTWKLQKEYRNMTGGEIMLAEGNSDNWGTYPDRRKWWFNLSMCSENFGNLPAVSDFYLKGSGSRSLTITRYSNTTREYYRVRYTIYWIDSPTFRHHVFSQYRSWRPDLTQGFKVIPSRTAVPNSP